MTNKERDTYNAALDMIILLGREIVRNKSLSEAESKANGDLDRLVRRSAATVSAKPIEWVHHTESNGQQWWDDQRYGFHIDLDPEEDPAYRYAAHWYEGGNDTFETLSDAQDWCQLEANQLVSDWATISDEREPPTCGEHGDW